MFEYFFHESCKFLNAYYDSTVLEEITISIFDSDIEFREYAARRSRNPVSVEVLGKFLYNTMEIMVNIELHDSVEEMLVTVMHELVHAVKFLLRHSDWAEEKEPVALEVAFKKYLREKKMLAAG
jgi:hypothetical protein